MNISAAAFKAECLKLMDEVARTGEPIVITKHGKPVAQLAPISPRPGSLFGYMRNTVTIHGDVMASIEDEWAAISETHDDRSHRAPAKSRSRRAGRKRTNGKK